MSAEAFPTIRPSIKKGLGGARLLLLAVWKAEESIAAGFGVDGQRDANEDNHTLYP